MAKLITHREIRSGVKASAIAIVRPDGSCPGEEFLKEVQAVQLESRIEMFCATGTLRTPEHFRRLGDSGTPPVWELKADKGPGYRLYGFRLGNRLVVTHGSAKPKPGRVKHEIDRARFIYEEWEARR